MSFTRATLPWSAALGNLLIAGLRDQNPGTNFAAEEQEVLRRELNGPSAGASSQPIDPSSDKDSLPAAIGWMQQRQRAAHIAVTFPRRLAQALVAEKSVIRLEDRELSWDEAERILFQKEERRVFLPLRTAMAQALQQYHLRDAEASLPDDSVIDSFLPSSSAYAECQRFLSGTDALGHAALDALSELGGVLIQDGPALARAWDFPEPTGAFADSAALDVARAGKHAAAVSLHREVRMLRVPRTMAGICVAATPGPVRAGWYPGQRAQRFFQLLSGVFTALLYASQPDLPIENGAAFLDSTHEFEVAAQGHAKALALAACLPSQQKFLFGVSSKQARRIIQIACAHYLLQARIGAALACSVVEHGWREDAQREALASLFHFDVGATLLSTWRLEPWPGMIFLPSAVEFLFENARYWMRAPSLLLDWRGHFDETFVLQPRFYVEFPMHAALDSRGAQQPIGMNQTLSSAAQDPNVCAFHDLFAEWM